MKFLEIGQHRFRKLPRIWLRIQLLESQIMFKRLICLCLVRFLTAFKEIQYDVYGISSNPQCNAWVNNSTYEVNSIQYRLYCITMLFEVKSFKHGLFRYWTRLKSVNPFESILCRNLWKLMRQMCRWRNATIMNFSSEFCEGKVSNSLCNTQSRAEFMRNWIKHRKSCICLVISTQIRCYINNSES